MGQRTSVRLFRDRRIVAAVVCAAAAIVVVASLGDRGDSGDEVTGSPASTSSSLGTSTSTTTAEQPVEPPNTAFEVAAPAATLGVASAGARSAAPARAVRRSVDTTTTWVVPATSAVPAQELPAEERAQSPSTTMAPRPRGFLHGGTFWTAADGSASGQIVYDWSESGKPSGVQGEREVGSGTWAPDLSGIAYVASASDAPSKYGQGLYWTDVFGGGRRALFLGGNCHSGTAFCRLEAPSFAPDGATIAFSVWDMYQRRGPIVTVPAAGGPHRVISASLDQYGNYRSSDASPTWSPDSRQIIFTSNRKNPGSWTTGLYLVNADGSGLTELSAFGEANYPRWSPDGNLVAFVSLRFGNADIFVARPDGTEIRRLTTAPQRDTFPVWSPDSRTIAYCGDVGLQFVDLDGRAPINPPPTERCASDWR